MTMQKVQMTVRGIQRNVYLEKLLPSDGKPGRKYLARTYVGLRGKTTVSGIYSINASGAQRFTPKGINASMV